MLVGKAVATAKRLMVRQNIQNRKTLREAPVYRAGEGCGSRNLRLTKRYAASIHVFNGEFLYDVRRAVRTIDRLLVTNAALISNTKL